VKSLLRPLSFPAQLSISAVCLLQLALRPRVKSLLHALRPLAWSSVSAVHLLPLGTRTALRTRLPPRSSGLLRAPSRSRTAKLTLPSSANVLRGNKRPPPSALPRRPPPRRRRPERWRGRVTVPRAPLVVLVVSIVAVWATPWTGVSSRQTCSSVVATICTNAMSEFLHYSEFVD
jgi:hypothetical protein